MCIWSSDLAKSESWVQILALPLAGGLWAVYPSELLALQLQSGNSNSLS